MARQEIILGTPPQGLGGDPPRVASMKINAMTQELYDSLPTNAAPLAVNRGGTGGKTASEARLSLGLVKVETDIDTNAGRIIVVGYGGLGAIDNARYVGTGIGPQYFRTGGVVTGQFQLDGVTPFLQSGWLITQAGVNSSTCSQSFVSWDNGNTYSRTMVNSTWRTWQKVYTDANTTRAADGTLKAI